jgi:hypothetical protein
MKKKTIYFYENIFIYFIDCFSIFFSIKIKILLKKINEKSINMDLKYTEFYQRENVLYNVPKKANARATELKGFAIIALLLLNITYFVFTIWFTTEFTSDGNGYIELWVPLFLYHGILLGLLLVFTYCYIHTVIHTPNGTASKATYFYPRYLWDVWTWFSSCIWTFALTLTLTIIFASKMGLEYRPDYNSLNPFERVSSVVYRNLYVILITSSFIGLWQSFDVLYSFILNIYELRTVGDITSKISKTEQIKLSPIPFFPHV